MEMNSKIAVRAEAVRMAMNVQGVSSNNIVAVSTKIADFIIGGSELPDIYNSDNKLIDTLAKVMKFSEIGGNRPGYQGVGETRATDKDTSDEEAAPQTTENA